jgi:araC-type DNA-binding domain-containing proteins
MPMGRKQKETVELRFYEIPQGEPVLALLGEEWNRVYGHDNFYLHFHNLMEIGICRKGEGELIINEHTYTYRTNSVTLIPPNIPHTTISNGMVRNSWEFLYVDVNHVMEELYGDRIAQKNEAIELVRRSAHLLHGSEYPEIAEIVNAIIREEKKQSPYYRQVITSYLHALVYEMFRLNEQTQTRLEAAGSGTMRQIADALTFVNDHYQEEVKVCTLAQVCGMSETSFRKVFEEYVHMLPMDYVNLVRVQYACGQMKHGNDSMDEVARKAGFSTTSTFNRNFKKFFNTSPYQWKINPQRYERKLQNFHINALKGW